jgi:CDP-2,3-bis-(O-geranylgeranyl)-sn-glycerol synthase
VIENIFLAIWFFLPAGVANATPVVANKIPVLKNWKTPLDFGRSYKGIRVLGPNKTWRGLLTGTIIAGVVALLQFTAHNNGGTWLGAFGLGALMGLGALTGDAIESFIKRQRGVPAGHSWFPFDQIDYIIGGLLIIYPFTRLPLHIIALIFVSFFGLHLLVAYIGYLLHLKDRPI